MTFITTHLFSVAEFEEMGHYFCDTILDYCDPDQSKVASTLRELQTLNPSAHVAPVAGQVDDSDSASSDKEEVIKVTKKKTKGQRRCSSSSTSSSISRKNSSSNSQVYSLTNFIKIAKHHTQGIVNKHNY